LTYWKVYTYAKTSWDNQIISQKYDQNWIRREVYKRKRSWVQRVFVMHAFYSVLYVLLYARGHKCLIMPFMTSYAFSFFLVSSLICVQLRMVRHLCPRAWWKYLLPLCMSRVYFILSRTMVFCHDGRFSIYLRHIGLLAML